MNWTFRYSFPSDAREETWIKVDTVGSNGAKNSLLPNYDVINSVSPIPPWQPKGLSSSGTDLQLARGVSDQAADGVYSRSGRLTFRTYDVTGKYYVADASPLGEVFFATKNMSVIVHEPKGTMPVIALPAGITKLKRTIWL